MAGAKAEFSLQSGLRYLPGRLSRPEQEELVEIIRSVVAEAPLYVPVMPGSGRPMSVRMTNCGPLGWVTDKERGYRYQPTHPVTNKPWPAIPEILLDLWRGLSGHPKDPEACLVNFYADDAKMGLHQDRDETDFSAPVLSISLGNTCLFRIGGLARTDRTKSLKLESGDVFLLGGEGRLCFHGVDRIYPDTSTLLKAGGRINLTLRRVNP
ncbi:alpha-ketoglutarate-dependent dioxygenase AlkB [Rhizobium sp. AQ_MP]|uniref:alpha-ketoglutarate-dependent dioxygenase AlkB n=1 Tax=Rhizobium sp. AQ_MP TaxID=2761536 RepID=UPI00163A7808|nr:alpha-ketoglutarate-dependent dioxygenase AlkB [Rhizobium sp. AQ_MP]MBC2772376.1 alpha-ketoglutarate-dependent dioxygenase AlkB [Rhizobium sp. AQ_MP]